MNMVSGCCFPVIFLVVSSLQLGFLAGKRQAPNIVYILADDLGRSDVGFTEGNHQTPTPNIDRLAWDGVILNRHYTNVACTPTRASLLTGKYVFVTGIQNSILAHGQHYGLPLDFTLLPQHLKTLNYSTWMLGKWHVGAHTRAHWPNARGFDYWLGFLEGDINYFTYETGWTNTNGRDLYENGKQVPSHCMTNHHLPDLFLEKFEQKIHEQDPNNYQPFFALYSTPLPHAGSGWDGENRTHPQHTMPEYNMRRAVQDLKVTPGSFADDTRSMQERKRQLAQIQALDDHVKRIYAALKLKGFLRNTIIVFASDNGAASRQLALLGARGSNWGSSWPLRMTKATLFEGGIRNVAFIWSPLLQRKGFISNQLFDITDWLPTLYEAAGGNLSDLGNINGISQWRSLRRGLGVGPRRETVPGIDFRQNCSALIWTDNNGHLWKLLQGNIVLNNQFTGWDRTVGTSETRPMTTPTPASVNCNGPLGIEQTPCRPWLSDCLFDLTDDPCELNNVADGYHKLVASLQRKLTAYSTTAVPSLYNGTFDPAGSPVNWNGWWVPWLDPVPVLPVNDGLCGEFHPDTEY